MILVFNKNVKSIQIDMRFETGALLLSFFSSVGVVFLDVIRLILTIAFQ